MLIDESYFIPIILFFTLLVLVLIFRLGKNKLPDKTLSYVLIISGIGVFVLLQSFGKKLYVVSQDLKVKEYIALGSFSVAIDGNDNEKVKGSIALNRIGVINKTSSPLMLEEITYSNNSYNSPSNEFRWQEIQPFAFEEVFTRTGKIDYFFEEKIPENVRTTLTRSSEIKYHLFQLK